MPPGSNHAPAPRATTPTDVFERAFQSSPTLQTIVRLPEGVLVEINETFTKVLGYPREKAIGKTPLELNFWVQPEKFVAYRQRMLAEGRARDFETDVRAKDGSVHTMLLSSEVVMIGGVPHSLTSAVDITERKRAEAELRSTAERLRQSEERFSKAFRANPAMVALTRVADGKFVSVNDAFVQITGYTEAEALGKTTVELGIYERPEVRQQFLSEIEARGFVRNHEHLLRTKGGELRTLLLSSEALDVDGAPHVLTVGLDITQRKRAEENLRESERRRRESEARFATAFRASPILLTMARMSDSRFVEVNEAFLRQYDFTREEVIGHTAQELGLWVHPEARSEFYSRLKQGGALRNIECTLCGRHGQPYQILLSADIIEINAEPHMLVFGLDITERKQAEENLRASEQRLRESDARFGTAFRASPLIMTVARLPEARYVEVNDAFTLYYGYTRKEAIGRTSDELGLWVHPAARDEFFARLQQARSLRNIECELRNRDGQVLAVLLSADIIEINGEPHLLAFALDVTQQKRAETEQLKALERERELSQLKTDFVALVSHEFRTPLEIIMSSVDNLDRYHARLPVEKREQLLRTINKSVRRMAGMMEEVLLLGRLDSGGTEFKPTPLDLAAFSRRVCDEMESATNRRCPIELTVAAAATKRARADEAVMRHILTNLLSNAVKYSEAGRPVELALAREGAAAVFRITDHGCGIPMADQARLFQAFHRGSNVRQVPGTGLGLLIVRRCVDLHGGTISFESTEGRGTTFTVRLPLFAAGRG